MCTTIESQALRHILLQRSTACLGITTFIPFLHEAHALPKCTEAKAYGFLLGIMLKQKWSSECEHGPVVCVCMRVCVCVCVCVCARVCARDLVTFPLTFDRRQEATSLQLSLLPVLAHLS